MDESNTPENNETPASAPVPPAPRPKRRWLKAVAYGGGALVALAVGTTGALWSWAGTDGSLATVLGWLGKSQPLTASGVRGSLRAGGHIDELQWQQDGLKVLARDVSLAWQPLALLHGRLQLDRLSAASIEADDQRAPSPKPSAPPASIGLPVPVTLEEFSVGQFQWRASSTVSVSGIAGHYGFNGLRHQLDLRSAQVASGTYSARATLSSSAPLMLEASVSGALDVKVPNRTAPLPLSLQASAQGPLTELAVKAELQMASPSGAGTEKTARTPHASATARVMPWAAQPLPQADADFHDLDIAALWPDMPQTLLTGNAQVRPAASTAPAARAAWLLALKLTNALPGPWDEKRLPVEQLDTQGEWRDGTALVRSLKARIGGGELLASGNWSAPTPAEESTAPAAPGPTPAPVPTPSRSSSPAWALNATLKGVNPAQLHSQLGPLLLDGQAQLHGQGALTQFDAKLEAAGLAAASAAASAPSGRNRLLVQLGLRDASATGSWNGAQGGGTLALSALQVRTDEAELSGQLEVQPASKSGQGKLALTAPGLEAKVNGELRETSGGGEFNLHGRNAAQALRWLQKLPGMPAALAGAAASGNAELQASWKGGWQDPALQARLDVPSLDWLPAAGPAPSAAKKPAAGTSTSTSTSTGASASGSGSGSTADTGSASAPASSAATTQPSPAPAAAPSPVKLRALQTTLSGRLSQLQLNTQGRVEMGQRRLSLQLAASGGRLKAAGASTGLAQSAWQGLLQQLSLSLEDPALGPGAWQLATSGNTALKWTPTSAGGAFETGAGQALLTAPAGKAASGRAKVAASQTAASQATTPPAAPSQATLAWRPVRWRPGELITAGRITGLPMAWIELIAGPQLAGLGGNLVFEGEWDAVLSNTLRLKASLARSSGDVLMQADSAQGRPVRLTAGIRQARLSLENVGEALSLSLVWDSERAGSASGQLKTRLARTSEQGTGWLWPQDAPLDGRLRARLPRIGVWSLLAPPGWRLRGSLGADVAISGTRAAPSLSGSLQADDLALRSVVDGIEFGNGRLRASLDGTRMHISEFMLQGAGDKGTGGNLTAQGEAGWIAGQPQVQLDAKLQRLRASVRSDRQVTVSGDLQARLQGNQAELTGKLLIDQARILLPDESTPQLGNDVIVRTPSGGAVGQNAPAQTSGAVVTTGREAARPVKLALELDLGRDFQVQGKGLDTHVRGTLALSGTSLGDPRLNGTIRTSGGQYRAYGQRLEVERGVLRFTGPIDNPALNILAVRPNLTQRVGVQITGTALLPSVRLYAQPDLPDAEKLSWLIVGRPSASGGAEAAMLQQAALALLGSKSGGMSGGLAATLGLDELSFRAGTNNADGTASGGAVTLGKRFSRNFYAAYERSLSGALGTLYVFYDLSRRFTIRAQAGEQSAVDLIFTIPYD